MLSYLITLLMILKNLQQEFHLNIISENISALIEKANFDDVNITSKCSYVEHWKKMHSTSRIMQNFSEFQKVFFREKFCIFSLR